MLQVHVHLQSSFFGSRRNSHWKHAFESTLQSFDFSVSNYHGYNCIFASEAFKDDCHVKQQKVNFTGSGDHHQKGVAEGSIQTVVGWARTLLLHAAIYWLAVADLKLWSFALQHAVYLWNILPNQQIELSPLELVSGSCVSDYTHLQCLHVWGCPTFVLDLKLHDEKKLPKWSPRSRLGCFIGYSSSHSSTVSLILNLQTGIVRPQYHLVHDDWFSTVINSLSSSLSSALWDIISIGYEHEDYDLSGAKDTWHDSETSTLRDVSRRGREMYA